MFQVFPFFEHVSETAPLPYRFFSSHVLEALNYRHRFFLRTYIASQLHINTSTEIRTVL